MATGSLYPPGTTWNTDGGGGTSNGRASGSGSRSRSRSAGAYSRRDLFESAGVDPYEDDDDVDMMHGRLDDDDDDDDDDDYGGRGRRRSSGGRHGGRRRKSLDDGLAHNDDLFGHADAADGEFGMLDSDHFGGGGGGGRRQRRRSSGFLRRALNAQYVGSYYDPQAMGRDKRSGSGMIGGVVGGPDAHLAGVCGPDDELEVMGGGFGSRGFRNAMIWMCCLAAMIAVAAFGAGIFVLVGDKLKVQTPPEGGGTVMATSSSSPADGNATGLGLAPSVGSGGLGGGANLAAVESPPPSLALECSYDAVRTEWGNSACRTLCDAASCCYLPTDDPNSCRDNFHESCAIYEVACSFLQEVTIPPPPQALVDKCTVKSIGTYAGFKACRDLCVKAHCCFLPPEDPNNCDGLNDGDCPIYQTACSNLNDIDVPPPPPDLSRVCSPKKLQSKDGFEICRAECEPASCCLVPQGEEGSCKGPKYNDRCVIYEVACGFFADEKITTFDQYVDEIVCNKLGIMASVKTYAECEAACRDHDCCFYPPWDANSCLRSASRDECEAYIGGCDVLDNPANANSGGGIADEAGKDVDPAPADLDVICGHDNLLLLTGRAECQKACEPALCCHEPNECNTNSSNRFAYDDNRFTCGQYHSCSRLYAEGYDPATAREVERTCGDDDMVRTVGGAEKCARLCKGHTCCWSPDPEENCFAEHHRVCVAVYVDCEVLMTEEVMAILNPNGGSTGAGAGAGPGGAAELANTPPGEFVNDVAMYEDHMREILQEVCTPGFLETSAACENLCQGRDCCFREGTKSCRNDEGAECDMYEPCSILRQMPSGGGAGAGGGEAGEDTSTVVREEDSQYDEQSDAAGAVAVAGGGGEKSDELDPLAQVVIQACENDSLDKGTFCYRYCSPAMCCFLDDSDNCREELREQCVSHALCAAFVGRIEFSRGGDRYR